MRWYVSRDGEVVGPVEPAELIEWVRTRPAEQRSGLFVRDEAASAWVPIDQSPFVAAIKIADASVAAELTQLRSSTPGQKRVVIATAAGGAMLLLLAIISAASSSSSAKTETLASSAPVQNQNQEPPKAIEVTPSQRMAAATSLGEAIAVAKPLMSDTTEDESPGAAILALWWARHPGLWGQLLAMPDTRRADIMKDPELYRGQRICLTGSVVQISRDKSVGDPVFLGVMSHSLGGYVRFIAVQSTQGIVEETMARFCGIAIGTRSYANTGGGTTIAAQVVGEFDIPANGGKGLQVEGE